MMRINDYYQLILLYIFIVSIVIISFLFMFIGVSHQNSNNKNIEINQAIEAEQRMIPDLGAYSLQSSKDSDSNSLGLIGNINFDHANSNNADSMTIVNSKYTNWKLYSSRAVDINDTTLSVFSGRWMLIVFISILMILVGFTLVKHIRYKPTQSILNKLGQYSIRQSEEVGIKNTNNEFTFIEMALDQLLKKSLDYESLFKEYSLLRQQRLFYDLLSGQQVLTDKQFETQMKALNMPYLFDRLSVIIVEIDYYTRFTEKYNPKDQHLLKFIIENAFHDLGEQCKIFVWHAWMEPNRIAFVVHQCKSELSVAKPAIELASEFQSWILHNLELTVTIGIGADSDSIETIAESYRNAKENVSLKPVFGTNTLIDNRVSSGKISLDNYAYLQAIENIVHSFRKNECDCNKKLTQLFKQLREMRFDKHEMLAFVKSFVMQMEKEINVLNPGIQQLWRNEFLYKFTELWAQSETLDELEKELMSTMLAFEASADQDRQARRHHVIAFQAKSYIDMNFADPLLSLTGVSAYLKLQPSSLSQLFKEELGEKFIDYVLRVRLEYAKRLLSETDEPIQSIAEQIGYQNVISFYRAFKKIQEIPPGEYRNIHRVHSK
ncbi:AraC family transcriptional regulator [Paenibacillus sp. FSL H8-0537]|uniref:AraC family transcriptional regulator n=1 Tax=Paenibacillus sp. FSL H8-0537 TaxID=2921399 RepID=UPI003101360C